MRVAITPHELWNDGLEKAAKNYVTDKSLDSMMTVLFDLHESLNPSEADPSDDGGSGFLDGMHKIGYTTLRDVSFRHAYRSAFTNS
jgi:hypothetical protein